MAIAALSDVKAYLDIATTDEDTRITALLAAVESQVKKYLGYDPAKQTYFDRLNGNGRRFVVPEQSIPLITVDSLTVDGVTIPAENGDAPGWYIDAGKVWLSGGYSFTRGFGNVKLSYQAGYETIPAAIKQAVVEMTAVRLKEIDRIGVSSKGIAGETISYIVKDVPDTVKGYLDPFRKVF